MAYDCFGLWFTGANLLISEGIRSEGYQPIASVSNNTLNWYGDNAEY